MYHVLHVWSQHSDCFISCGHGQNFNIRNFPANYNHIRQAAGPAGPKTKQLAFHIFKGISALRQASGGTGSKYLKSLPNEMVCLASLLAIWQLKIGKNMQRPKGDQKWSVDSPMRNSTDIFLHRRFILSCCQAVWPMMVWRHGRHLGSSSGIAQHRPLLKITQAPPQSSLCIRYYIPCSGVFEVFFILHTHRRWSTGGSLPALFHPKIGHQITNRGHHINHFLARNIWSIASLWRK